jgi:hypothetical protein
MDDEIGVGIGERLGGRARVGRPRRLPSLTSTTTRSPGSLAMSAAASRITKVIGV